MTRSDLIARLAERAPGLRGEDYERLVAIIFGTIADQMEAGGRVELRGFGSFFTKRRDARVGRNPRSGAAIDVPAKRVMGFRASGRLEGMLNQSAGSLDVRPVTRT